jgi:hypothetical protein
MKLGSGGFGTVHEIHDIRSQKVWNCTTCEANVSHWPGKCFISRRYKSAHWTKRWTQSRNFADRAHTSISFKYWSTALCQILRSTLSIWSYVIWPSTISFIKKRHSATLHGTVLPEVPLDKSGMWWVRLPAEYSMSIVKVKYTETSNRKTFCSRERVRNGN